LQIVNQLGQILDGVNIVMWRRRNQTYSGSRIANAGNLRINLVAGQLSSFTGLGALSHLNLYFLSVDQVFTGHPESSGRHLLDGTTTRVAVGTKNIPTGIFTSFSGVTLTANTVHGNR